MVRESASSDQKSGSRSRGPAGNPWCTVGRGRPSRRPCRPTTCQELRMRSVRALAAVTIGLVFLPGCGGPAMAPVKGRVTCNGKPVAEAAITFSPIPESAADREPGKPGTGFTDADGTFSLSTFKNYDGALVAKHKVTVM